MKFSSFAILSLFPCIGVHAHARDVVNRDEAHRGLRKERQESKPAHHSRTKEEATSKHAVEAQGRQPGSKSRTKSRTKVRTEETPMHHTRTVGTGEARSRTKHTVEPQGRQPGSKSRTKSRTKVGTKETQERQESKPDGEPRDADCTNYAEWVDSDGDGCIYYESDPSYACAYYGHLIGTDGLTSEQACCVCDGVEPPDDTWDGESEYADCNVADWVDSDGDGCIFYESEPSYACAYYGHLIGTDGLTALQACCVCDGVEPPNDTWDGESEYADCNVAEWTDSYGDGCEYYERFEDACAYYGTDIGTDGLTPLQACCVCDGGELPPQVSCGGHQANSCAECPQGNGAGWCNGSCVWADDACEEATTPPVSCGGHQANSCEECPQGNGAVWCNGSCAWVDGACKDENYTPPVNTSPVSCGGHQANSCAECPQGNGAGWCNGSCSWVDGACEDKN